MLAAIDAGNLKLVALSARRRWPFTELVIASDDDRLSAGNPGATKAPDCRHCIRGAAGAAQWPENAPKYLTYFNDLAVWLAGGCI